MVLLAASCGSGITDASQGPYTEELGHIDLR